MPDQAQQCDRCAAPSERQDARFDPLWTTSERRAQEAASATSPSQHQPVSLQVLLAWSFVALPLVWGFFQTIRYAALLLN